AASIPPMRQRNHARRFEGIPKCKLQASGPSDRETLQFQNPKAAQKRLSLNGLELVHSRRVSSGADGVGHAFLGEARLAGAIELLLSRLGVARLLRVVLAFLHEAGEGRACERLIPLGRYARLHLAGALILRGGAGG